MPGIDLGLFSITYYGIILMLGAVAAAFLAEREARRRGLQSDMVWDALIWVLIGGIVGARLWHVFTPPPSMVEQGITTAYYLTHPLDLINTRAGGVGIPGAIIGGGLALYLFTRRRKINFGTWADVAAPALALGQAIGRWGNFVNQEVYGAPTTLPWAITIDPAHRLAEYANFSRYHPLFLYESLWNLGNMGLLLWLSRRYGRRLKPGDVFLAYLVIYPVGRFWMEFLRLDSAQVAGINANQTVALVVALGAGFLLYWRHRNDAQEIEEDAEETEFEEVQVDQESSDLAETTE
jgi:phosphatidylglycerol:prolipoprotein diacylglycerol transferase